MKFVRIALFVLLACGVFFTALAQVPPPDTGKMSWDLFQAVEAGQRKRAVGQEVETVTALLVTDCPATEENLLALVELGYTVLGSFGQFVLVEGPADQYADPEKGLGVIDFVSNAALPPTSITSQAAPLTNGTAAIGADQVWNTGYRGEGVKVAVIDVGFDPDNAVLAQFNPTLYAITPSAERVGAYRPKEGVAAQISHHGTSCAIIAGDVAPEAELYLLSYPVGTEPIGWLCALHFAVYELGVDVVSTSVEFTRPYCHADGTGLLNEQVNQVLNGTDTALVIAAGNWAAGSESDRTFYSGIFADSESDYSHDFTSDTEDAWNKNTLRFSGGEGDRITIVLEWDDWEAASRSQDLDLFLYDADYRVLLASSRTQQLGRTTDPAEILIGELPYSGDYCIAVDDRAAKWHDHPSRPVSFHLNLYNRDNLFDRIEHHSTCGSIRGVATNPKVIAVGAVSVEDGTLRPYSSRGPTADGRSKPELCAPDGVSGTDYPTFYGTSAAAPYVAGAIALLRSVPQELPRQELLLLQETATSLSTKGDREAKESATFVQEMGVGSADGCGNPVYRINLQEAIEKLVGS